MPAEQATAIFLRTPRAADDQRARRFHYTPIATFSKPYASNDHLRRGTRMTSRIASTLTAVCALLGSGAVYAAEKEFSRSFEVSPGERLSVTTEGGQITVVGTDANRVVVRMRAKGSEERLEKITMSAERNGDGVAVVGKRDSGNQVFGWFGSDVNISVAVEVPRTYNIDLNTSGGDINVRQINGTAVGRTSGGRVNVESIRGDVRMRTSGGRMEARSIQGDLELQTSGGSITASNVSGRVRANSSGGSIRLERVNGAVEAHTSGGSINIELAGKNEGIVAKTSGGSISLRIPSSATGDLNASTSGGRVSSDLTLTVSEIGKSAVRGKLNGGGPEILARTSGGSIQIVGGS
jgi:Putative adhesin